jgi:rhodanese-related sulfurtransferase
MVFNAFYMLYFGFGMISILIMSFTQFLGHNLGWVALFIILFIVLAIVEYLDNGRGVKKLTTHEAIKFMGHNKHLMIDLRNYIEFEKGYIKGAKQIALDALKHKADEHIKKKETPVLLDGEFSAVTAATHLKKQGFAEVYVLKGGIKNWKKENLPLTKEVAPIAIESDHGKTKAKKTKKS